MILIVGLFAISSVSASEINDNSNLENLALNDGNLQNTDIQLENSDTDYVIEDNLRSDDDYSKTKDLLSSEDSLDDDTPSSSTTYKVERTEVWLQSSLSDNAYILDEITKYPKSKVKFYVGISNYVGEEYGGNVTLILNGKSYTAKVYDGLATIVATTPSKVGSYKAILKYGGCTYDWVDEVWKYSPSSSKFTLRLKKIPTSVSAAKVTAKYKQSKYFSVRVKDKVSKKFLKNTQLILKVYTGKKYKTYKVKTNSKGIAKLNTKRFSVGTHKVLIRSGNKNYNIQKTSKIIIKKAKTNKKSSLKSVMLKVKTFKNGESFSTKCTRLPKGDGVVCLRQNYDAQFGKGVHVIAWYVGYGDGEDIEPYHNKLIKAKFYFKNSKGKVITRTAKSDSYGTTVYSSFISGYTPFKAQVWYKTK